MDTFTNGRHKWKRSDEELALSLYLSGKTSPSDIANAIKGTGINSKSMTMKLMNIKYLDTGVGLKNATNLTKKVFAEYKNTLTQNS
jgi:hypothetical protein